MKALVFWAAFVSLCIDLAACYFGHQPKWFDQMVSDTLFLWLAIERWQGSEE